MGYDPHNSHYLNQKNRLFPQDPRYPWVERDADYNIRSGLTFGESEQITLRKQGWEGKEN